MRPFLGRKAKGSSSFDPLPVEMIILALSFVDADDLLNCRLVCVRWRQLIDNFVFREKASRENRLARNGRGFHSFSEVDFNTVDKLDLPWFVFRAICKYDPFNRNLLNNHHDLDKCTYSPLYDDIDSFMIERCIAFQNFGLTSSIMQSIKPAIVIKESCCSCMNCMRHLEWVDLKISMHHSHFIVNFDFIFVDEPNDFIELKKMAFERSFSILKVIKTRLKNTLNEDNLEAFMLMTLNKEILSSMDSDLVIDLLKKKE